MREALVTSVLNSPVNLKSNQESMVPNAKLLASLIEFFNNQAILLAEKYGAIGVPVFLVIADFAVSEKEFK